MVTGGFGRSGGGRGSGEVRVRVCIEKRQWKGEGGESGEVEIGCGDLISECRLCHSLLFSVSPSNHCCFGLCLLQANNRELCERLFFFGTMRK